LSKVLICTFIRTKCRIIIRKLVKTPKVMNFHVAMTFNCVYTRKRDTCVDRDFGQWPPTLTEVISTSRQSGAHLRRASFLKDCFSFLFSHTLSFVLAPFVKTIPRRLRISLLRKNIRQEGFFTLVGPSFVFCSVGSDHVLWMHFGIFHDAIALWIFIRLFIWSELPEDR